MFTNSVYNTLLPPSIMPSSCSSVGRYHEPGHSESPRDKQGRRIRSEDGRFSYPSLDSKDAIGLSPLLDKRDKIVALFYFSPSPPLQIYFLYVYQWWVIHRGQSGATDPLQLGLKAVVSCLTWVLGTRFQCSESAANTS